jgi:hypothetical protein
VTFAALTPASFVSFALLIRSLDRFIPGSVRTRFMASLPITPTIGRSRTVFSGSTAPTDDVDSINNRSADAVTSTVVFRLAT